MPSKPLTCGADLAHEQAVVVSTANQRRVACTNVLCTLLYGGSDGRAARGWGVLADHLALHLLRMGTWF